MTDERIWPAPDLELWEAVLGYLDFLTATAILKLEGLREHQARSTPLPDSPVMSPLGLLKHLTAVQREHIQRHIGGQDLPSLWRADDHDHEFRVGPDETIASVVAALQAELVRSHHTLSAMDPEAVVIVDGQSVGAGRLLVDVVQESARHVGHLDIVRELIDGAKGE